MIYSISGTRDKAKVSINYNGCQTLISYDTPIMIKHPDGRYTRLVDWISATTGKHIKLFSGLNKKQFLELNREA